METAKISLLLGEATRDMNWFTQHRRELEEKFDKRFVAIKNEEIIASGASIEEILQKVEAKGFNPGEVLIEFVSKLVHIL